MKLTTKVEPYVINVSDIDYYSSTGLAKSPHFHKIADALCEVGFDDHIDALETKLDHALLGALSSKMPAPAVTFSIQEDDFARGRFVSETWEIKLSDRLIYEDGFPDLLSVVAHELRHAEQAYLRTIHLLDVGYSEEQTEWSLHVPRNIVKHAARRPNWVGNDEMAFGRYLAYLRFDEALNEKTIELHEILKKTAGTDEYRTHQKKFADETPVERDAYAFQRMLKAALEDCFHKSQG